MLDYRIILFSYIPCMICASYTGLAWLGIRLSLRTTVLAGLTATLVDFLARKVTVSMNVPPGWDLPLMVVILMVVLKVYTDERWAVTFAGSVISYILIASGDYIILPALLKVYGMTVQEIFKHPWLVVLTGNLNSSIIYTAGLVAYFKNLKIIDLSQPKYNF